MKPILNPESLAIQRREMATAYNEYKKETGEILKRKAFEIIRIKADVKTWKEAEATFDITDDGQKLIELDMKCKGLIELMRSLKTEIDIKNNEAFGTY